MAQTLYDDWIMTFFNILFTAWPPIAVAVFETDISAEVIDAVPSLFLPCPPPISSDVWSVPADQNPNVYERVQSNRVFTLWTLSGWFLAAIYHSLGSLCSLDDATMRPFANAISGRQ